MSKTTATTMRRFNAALTFAHLLPLTPGPAAAARKVKPKQIATNPVPKLAAMPVPKPTTAAAPAPKRLNFAHLASASASTSTSTGPLLALPTAPAPATVNTTPKTDPAAIDAQWDQAHRRAASYLPFAQAGRDAAARRWDKLMQSVMGRH